MSRKPSAGTRSRARELIVQALYQQQITGHTTTELLAQIHDRRDYAEVDQEYFDESLVAIREQQESIMAQIDEMADRPVAQLDPIELAILLLGTYELQFRVDVPYRVVINEAVNLAKMFGAVDGHKYINALLDRAAKQLRPAEGNG
jgi:N utilization substance protein B